MGTLRSFIARAGTGLRCEPRACRAAGGAAFLQYGAIVTWVGICAPEVWTHSTVDGVFQWHSQWSRLQLIAMAAVIHAAVVVRSRAFWLPSMRDQLTGLFNRGFSDDSCARLPAGVPVTPFTVALIDLDHCKPVNDRPGHAASLPEDGTGRGLIDTADRRLYAAKEAGRIRLVADDPEAA